MSDETENGFGPALVLALGLAFTAMFWVAGNAHSAELDGGTKVAAVQMPSEPCSGPRCSLPWKIAIAMGVKPGPDEPPVLVAYGVVREGFKTEAECRGKKGLGDKALKKINSSFQVKLSQKLGLPLEAVVIVMDCIDSTKVVPTPAKPAPKKLAPGEEEI